MFLLDKKIGLGVGSAVLLASGSAMAEVPTGVTTAITEAVTDVGVIGAAILIVVVAVAAFNWLRKPVH